MKVLVVDDDVVSRMALVELVREFGRFDIVEAVDGEEAWELLEKGLLPVVICCDVRMPRLSGIELLQRLKTNTALSAIPFVIVSSASDRDTVQQAIKLGAAGYILKPFTAKNAYHQLEKICAQYNERMLEHPTDTRKRLNVAPLRLLAYLGALETKLPTDMAEIGKSIEAGDIDATKARLDSLHTGCETLGFWQVARMVDLFRQQPNLHDLERISGEVASTLADQIKLAREVFQVRN